MSVTDTARHVPDASSREAILRFIQGFMVSRALHVVTALGIPDLLNGGPKDSNELAEATATHAPSLYRLLRALVSVGVLALDEAGRFALTPMGAPLPNRGARVVARVGARDLGRRALPRVGRPDAQCSYR